MMMGRAIRSSWSALALAALAASFVIIGCGPQSTDSPEARVDEAGEPTPQPTMDAESMLCEPDHIVTMMDEGGSRVLDPCAPKVSTGDCVKFRNETEVSVSIDTPPGLFQPDPGKLGPGDSVFVEVVEEVESETERSYKVESEAGDFSCLYVTEGTPRIIVRPPPQQKD